VFGILSKVEKVIPSTLLNPKIRRNFIGFAYSVLEPTMKTKHQDFFDEF